jgi:peptide/nickel transport system ATP-binding protein
MYAGRIAEEATVEELFARPLHPYSAGLQRALPRADAEGARLAEIRGIVPSLREPIPGCAFAPRCALATERCRSTLPALRPFGAGHHVACWEAERVAA